MARPVNLANLEVKAAARVVWVKDHLDKLAWVVKALKDRAREVAPLVKDHLAKPAWEVKALKDRARELAPLAKDQLDRVLLVKPAKALRDKDKEVDQQDLLVKPVKVLLVNQVKVPLVNQVNPDRALNREVDHPDLLAKDLKLKVRMIDLELKDMVKDLPVNQANQDRLANPVKDLKGRELDLDLLVRAHLARVVKVLKDKVKNLVHLDKVKDPRATDINSLVLRIVIRSYFID